MSISQHDLSSSLDEHTCGYVWSANDAILSPCALEHLSWLLLGILACIFLYVVARSYSISASHPGPKLSYDKSEPNAQMPNCNYASKPYHTLLRLLAMISVAIHVQQIINSPGDIRRTAPSLFSWAIVMLILTWRCTTKSVISLLVYYVPASILNAASMSWPIKISTVFQQPQAISGVLSAISIVVVLLIPISSNRSIVENNKGIDYRPSEGLESPENRLRLYQFLTVSWIKPLTDVGRQGNLKQFHIWRLPPQVQARKLHEASQSLKGKMLGRILENNRAELIAIIIISVAGLLCEAALPLVYSQLLHTMNESTATKRAVMTYVFMSLALRMAIAQLKVLNTWCGRRCYERSRAQMTLMVFEKALQGREVTGPNLSASTAKRNVESPTQLPSHSHRGFKKLVYSIAMNTPRLKTWLQSKVNAKRHVSASSIFTLFRGDVSQLSQQFCEVNKLIKIPMGLLLTIVFIWRLLGPSCFLGIKALVAGQVTNALFTRVITSASKKRRSATDHRLQLTSEFVEVIRHLRWYGWHRSWLKKVLKARQTELKATAKFNLLQGTLYTLNAFSNVLFPCIALYSFSSLNQKPLTVDILFPAGQLFLVLGSRLQAIPDLLTSLIDTSVALQRIDKFMEEDLKGTPLLPLQSVRDGICLNNCSFSWPGSSQPILKSLNLSFPKGLTVVKGKVGSGKTAFLHALLGEMDVTAGTCSLPDRPVGYCAQTPWLQSMSIKDNILFSAPYERELYHHVLDACELNQDLESLGGHLAMIGENGVGLSGGQRARVALARAIYSRPEYLILDDPFAALDRDTADSIARKVFGSSSLLKDCTIVLASHQPDIVYPFAFQLLEISEGSVIAHRLDKPQKTASSILTSPNAAIAAPSVPPTEASKAPVKFMEDEKITQSGIKFRVFWMFIKAGGMQWWLLQLAALALSQAQEIAKPWYLKSWGEAYKPAKPPVSSSMGLGSKETSTSFRATTWTQSEPSSPPVPAVTAWVQGYLLLSLVNPAMTLITQISETAIVYFTAEDLFNRALQRISGATFRYYDVTPVGRLLNHLTSDMANIDGKMSVHLMRLSLYAIAFAFPLITVSTIAPPFVLIGALVVTICVSLFRRYIPTSQSLRRLESTALSPLFTQFSELPLGLPTIRAFRAQSAFRERMFTTIDKYQSTDHFFWALNAWLMYRLETLTAFMGFFLTSYAVWINSTPGLTAFVLAACLDFINATSFLYRQYGVVQREFVSVERIEALIKIEQEPLGAVVPPPTWPTQEGKADIVFDNVTIRYADYMNAALENVNVVIPGGSSVAVIGRTGSGKTTFVQSILAIVRISEGGSGRITIGDLDVSEVNVDVLRRRVTYVAQDPILFAGTLRDNLDPIGEFSDQECAAVLRRVSPGDKPWLAEMSVAAGGRNFSQGERQLVGIARAILRRSAVLLMDEATASVDNTTSLAIQRVLKEEMKTSTVITIAHRPELVQDVDFVLELRGGRVKMFSANNRRRISDTNP